MLLPEFSDAEPLLYFLDKYTTILVSGAKAMGKFCPTRARHFLTSSLHRISRTVFWYMRVRMMCGQRKLSKQRRVPPKKTRKHSNVSLSTSTIYEELELLCIKMDGPVMGMSILVHFAVKLRI